MLGFLANIVLLKVDRAIGVPFARWVDDYRIFVNGTSEAESALNRLQVALASCGYELNSEKVAVVPAHRAAQVVGQSLTSVYHPDKESAGQVRSSLRSVFVSAAQDPVRYRRQLRFVLPRLAAEQDEVALDWAFHALFRLPWEAPRICTYVSAFAGDKSVADRVQSALSRALMEENRWVAIRLAAASCVTGLSGNLEIVNHGLRSTSSAALWSLLIRSLALAGCATEVRQEVDRRCLDPRAAAASLTDIGTRIPDPIRKAAPHTASLLADRCAPPPVVDTIL